MSGLYEELVYRIRGEVSDLDRLVQKALRVWSRVQKPGNEQDIYLDSIALNLHGFYSGIERLFELIARHVDQRLPAGEMWHRDLLQQMAEEITNVRPAVISPERIASLDHLRRFRHLVRNVYTFNLSPDKLKSLIADLPGLWLRVQAELLAFADFLSELSRPNQT